TFTPTPDEVGAQAVTIHVSDGHGGMATQTFNLAVVASATNNPPMITSSPRTTVGMGANYLYQVAASDPDADALTFSLATAPAGMTISAAGLVHWQPSGRQLGANPVEVRVDDGRGGLARQDFTVTVNVQNANQPPQIISTAPTTAIQGQPYQYDAIATDPDGDPVVWDLNTAPDGMSINPNLATLRWTPTSHQIGIQLVR